LNPVLLAFVSMASAVKSRASSLRVMRGLDPRIQNFTKKMDRRVSPRRGGPAMTIRIHC
jgi:hypothetical protein